MLLTFYKAQTWLQSQWFQYNIYQHLSKSTKKSQKLVFKHIRINMEYFSLKILKRKQNKFNSHYIMRQTTFEMNVEQILRKESLDQILHRKRNLRGQGECSEEQMIMVSNYLDLPMGSPSFFNQQSQNSNEFPQISFSLDNPATSLEPEGVNIENSSKKRSIFHNFQKHLMTTLRSNINIRKSSHSDHSQSNIASELWQYFKFSSRISKRFLLCLLFGRNNQDGSGSSAYYEDYSKLVEEFNEYNETELNMGQAYLCRQIIRQSRKLIDSGAFEGRRINHSQEFKKYFERFVVELENGRISKRLPKASKFLKTEVSTKNNIQ